MSQEPRKLQDEMNKLSRSEYTFEMCIEKALAQKKQGSIVGGERQFSAYAAPAFTPQTFAAFLTGTTTSLPGVVCTNCGDVGGHPRKTCPKPCRIPLPGGRSGDCNGIAPNHLRLDILMWCFLKMELW